MLQSLRDHTQGWIAGIIISILILSFALWGIHSYLDTGGTNNVVAKVNGVEISKNQLTAAYERMRRQLQLQYQSATPLSDQTETSLKKRALDSLIENQVMTEAAYNQGFRISSTQVDRFLMNLPEFQVNGRFSVTRFQQFLNTSLFNGGDFLRLIENTLLTDQPRLGLIFSSFALPNEVQNAMALINQERDINYAFIPWNRITQQIIIAPEKIQLYYQQHQDEFKTKEEVSVDYILLSLKDLMANIHPTDAQLKTFYNDNSNAYSDSAKQTVPNFEKIKDKVKMDYIHQTAEEKFGEQREKLANLTYEHPESLEPASKALGLTVQSTPAFNRDSTEHFVSNSKIRDAAFSSDVLNGNNSDIIQLSEDEAVVLHVKNHNPPAVLSLKTVEPQITEKLKQEQIAILVQNQANDIVKKLRNGATPDQIAHEYGLVWQDSGLIGRQSNKINANIINTAFAMPHPKNHIASYAIAKVPEGYAIINLKAIHEGTLSKSNQQQVFAEQIQMAQGLMEYELYKKSLVNQAKISIE